MTTSNTPPQPPNRPNFVSRLWTFARRPSTLMAIGGTIVVMGTAGYIGIRYFVYNKLSPLLESKISEFIGRDVEIGEVESFNFNRVRLGKSVIPKTATDPDNASIQAIEVSLNPLPLLIGRPLGIDILLVDPNVYLEQDKAGQWVRLEPVEREVQELPFNLDINVQIEDADVTLKSKALTRLITLHADGKGRYIDTKDQQIEYDLQATLLNSKIAAKGKTILKTGKTEAELVVTQLDLGQLSSLFPDLPIVLNQGQFDANLAIDFPSTDQIKETRGTGNLSITEVTGKVLFLNAPLKLNTKIDLQGQKVFFEQVQFTLGKNQGNLKGELDWQEGYNLDVVLNTVDVPQLLQIFSIQIPVEITGLVQADFKVRGLVDKPQIEGKFSNIKTIYFDKIPLKDVRASFQTNLDTLKLKGIQILPTAGGKITSSGDIQLGILYAWKNNKPIKGQYMGLNFEVEANIPPQKILTPYLKLPQEIAIGNVDANATISGKVGRPQVVLNWQAPNNTIVNKLNISGQGEARIVGDNLTIRNTTLKADNGTINLNGQGNFKTKQWQTTLTANAFPLSPFLPIVCEQLPATCPYTKEITPVNLNRANVKLSGKFAPSLVNTVNTIEGIANLGLNLKNGTVAINSQFDNGNIQATTIASEIPLNPFLPNLQNEVKLLRSQVNFTGSIGQILAGKTTTLNNWQGQGNVQLLVDNRPFNAEAQLNQGILKGSAFTSGGLSLNPFLPKVTIPVSLGRTRVNFSGSIDQLLNNKTLDLTTFNADANLQIFVNNNSVNTRAKLTNGIINTITNIEPFSLTQFLPKFPIPTQVLQTKINVSGNAQSLLNSFNQKQLDLSSFTVLANSRLTVAQGNINASASLKNNQWQSNIIANNLDSPFLLNQLTQQKLSLNLPDLNANINLSGNIKTLFQENATLPIQANSVSIQLGEQTLNAQGNLLVSNLTTNPDITNLKLDIQARSNLSRLPFNQLLTSIPVNRRFLPEELYLTGIGQFTGQITGKNLLTAFSKPGSLQINGNVRLANLSFNQRQFEPLLTGTLQAGIGQNFALNLRGEQDVIAATLDPCTRQACILPYLPLTFEIRQVVGTQTPFIVKGEREGERLIANIEQFPLEVLKIAPGLNYDIPNYFSGELTADIDINLFTLAGRGQINIKKPGLGILEGETFNAEISYNDGLAQLSNAKLIAGRSQYEVEGLLNFNTGVIQGELNVAQGYIEDILTALNISDLDSVLRLLQLQKLDNATANQMQTTPVGDPKAPISEQVNLLAKIDEIIRQLADKRDVLGVPTQLDIRGQYQANISLAGTLKNPQLNVQFQGENWQWHPQEPTPDIVNPLGLVITDTQLIPINEVTLNASFNNGMIQVQPARLVIRGTVLSLAGDFSLFQSNANFDITNLSTDLIQEFVNLPIDLYGNFNAQGTIAGSFLNPQVEGQFSFVDGAINARSLEQDIAGQFNYTDYRLTLQTTEPSLIDIYASIPYPPIPQKNDQFDARIRLGTDAIGLIDAITQGQIDWVGGNGEVDLQAQGRLEFDQGLKLKDLVAKGTIVLEDAAIKTAALPEILTVNGRINLTPEYLQVEQLQGTISQSQIAITGILPIFEPIAANYNPLMIDIEQGKVNLEGLYQGEIDGEVTINGTAFQPVISGKVELSNGQVYVPQTDSNISQPTLASQRWLSPITNRNLGIPLRLENFQVTFNRLSIEQEPLYQFNFNGALTLNGLLNDLDNLKPNGVITLDRGRISFLDTRFLLNRRHKNVIVFDPAQGIFNPRLDIQMRTIVTELPDSGQGNFRDRRSEFSNEIPDSSLNRVQRIDVTLSLAGQLNQLIPGLGKDVEEDVCRIRSNDLPFPSTQQQEYTPEELQNLMNCINTTAFAQGEDQQSLLSSSAVQLSSSPPRSQGEIVRLLGDQLLIFVESLQGKNTDQLIQFGVVQLAIPLVLQGVVYDVESTISNSIGATDFNILPYLEAVYSVDKESFIRFSYDYNFNEVTVRYETRF